MLNNTSSSTPGDTPPGSGTIGVMLVDDSAVIRGILSKTLESDPAIKVVNSVSNGEMAVSAIKKANPHIIILDIEMPVMDGLTALPKLLEICPDAKVIMFSSLTEKGASVTMKAMTLGAVECLVKPNSSQETGEGTEFQKNLLNLIKGLVPERQRTAGDDAVTMPRPSVPAAAIAPEPTAEKIVLQQGAHIYKGKPSVVAIGSSTGGPQALFEVIKSFKDFDVPIFITQHMPATFTKILADHIEQQSGVPTCEGAEGMAVEKGHAYVAPGGFHMKIIENDGQLSITIDSGPPENFCKPSADPMFRSLIDIFDKKVLGVILTGMGHDGLGGAKLLVEKGGRLIAQDEATSVVWGMPGAVAQAGICNAVIPLSEIGPHVRKIVLG
ncbi:MAG: chemotaxis response regulator protein-glutamate methylesterase 1 [Micavibrio sp.]|nr:MAG: chemotaxis response regulator protein-glutamate methylesterase 1 [Micavibrio sp.]